MLRPWGRGAGVVAALGKGAVMPRWPRGSGPPGAVGWGGRVPGTIVSGRPAPASARTSGLLRPVGWSPGPEDARARPRLSGLRGSSRAAWRSIPSTTGWGPLRQVGRGPAVLATPPGAPRTVARTPPHSAQGQEKKGVEGPSLVCHPGKQPGNLARTSARDRGRASGTVSAEAGSWPAVVPARPHWIAREIGAPAATGPPGRTTASRRGRPPRAGPAGEHPPAGAPGGHFDRAASPW